MVLDVISDASEDVSVGQTLKHPFLSHQLAEEQKQDRLSSEYDKSKVFGAKDIPGQSNFLFLSLAEVNIQMSFYLFICKACQSYISARSAGSSLTLEVISGPCRGLRFSVHSTSTSKLPVTFGRVSPCDILLKDSEVSGKHALINWNLNVNFFITRLIGLVFGFEM